MALPATSLVSRLDGTGRQVLLTTAGELVGPGGSVHLSGRDGEAVRLLLEHHPDGVSVNALERKLWPTRRPTDFARRSRLMRLRRQFGTAGLALRWRAETGYSIEPTLTR